MENNSKSIMLFHYKRLRINQLFTEAVRYPLVVICAGTGYGKTSAIHDFTTEQHAAWMQLSEYDNSIEHFWNSYTNCIAKINLIAAKTISNIGFPNSKEKINKYHSIINNSFDLEKQLIVIDDFQFLENNIIINFVEECILFKMPPGTSVLLISRSTPHFNTVGPISKGLLFNVNENDLRFTDNELTNYFSHLDILLKPECLHEIMQDTGGWAFAINFIARSYQRAPGYTGYLSNAMKINVFKQMETEIWDEISNRMKFFLIRLSLIDHLSFDLIKLLTEGDLTIILEFERQNAYIRRDNNIDAYVINPLFLEFLYTKQEFLSWEQKKDTYKIAGDWCNRNGFKTDAIKYYEKTGDYSTIVSIFIELPAQIPADIAKCTAAILDRTNEEKFNTIEFLAATHIRSYIYQGLWKKAIELLKFYEANFLAMTDNDIFRNRNLSAIYLCWGSLRNYMCLIDNRYDFDIYYGKFRKRYFKATELGKLAIHSLGPWIITVGSSKKGSPDEYIYALSRATSHFSNCFLNFMAGEDDLARGELMFFKGDLRVAEHYITRALTKARENGQFEVFYRALLYTLRISIAQGNYEKAEQAFKEAKSLNDSFPNFYVNYEIFISWYFYMLSKYEQIPDWLKQNFSPYGHPGFIENFENQAKARFYYATRCYTPLLVYIHEMKQRESYLFGRIEMLAIEACVLYKMKEKAKAIAMLQEAYKISSPNDLVMPFIELGKDMRTLTSYAMKESECYIPKIWLNGINRKAASYAKRQANVTRKYKQAYHIADEVAFSPRETEVLLDLSQGLSRMEIATSRGLSINTVKMIINMIYAKAGAGNLADLIRIAVERKLV